jgi:hypothetical protein
MRREPILRSAVLVVLTWIVLWGLLHRDTAWNLIQTGLNGVLLVGALSFGAAVVGLLAAMWLSSEEHDSRIDAIVPKPMRGMKASIGIVPLHTRPAEMFKQGKNEDPRQSLQFVFDLLQNSPDLVPVELRRSRDNPDGIDLKAIAARVMALDTPYIAWFDAVLRVLMHNPNLLTTYEREGHGRHNGIGGRTLLQHSLLVCQCAIEIAPKWSYDGMHTISKEDGVPGDLAYAPRRAPQVGYDKDPLVPLIGLAHDIGKIQCYQWAPGQPEPYALAPNHDLIGARMIAVMPQTFALPASLLDEAESDFNVLITAIGFYHHPSEQPMDGAGIKPGAGTSGKSRIMMDLGGVQIRSDRQVALMELLIAADKQAGAIEHRATARLAALDPQAPVQDEAPGAAGATAATPAASPEAAIWEAIEVILSEPGRINAKQSRGMVSSLSVATLHHLPEWGGPVLVCKEDDFVKAVIERADIPPDQKDGLLEGLVADRNAPRANSVSRGTLMILRSLHAHGMLITPPGNPEHTPETSLWKISFYEPGAVYRDGVVANGRLPAINGSPAFRWGSTILCAPAKAMPTVAAGPAFHLVPVCNGNRMGNAGNMSKKGKSSKPAKSILDDDVMASDTSAGQAETRPDTAPGKEKKGRHGDVRADEDSFLNTFMSLVEAGLRKGEFKTHVDSESRIAMDNLLDEIVGIAGARKSLPTIRTALLEGQDQRLSLEETRDTSGRLDYRVLVDADWFASITQPEIPDLDDLPDPSAPPQETHGEKQDNAQDAPASDEEDDGALASLDMAGEEEPDNPPEGDQEASGPAAKDETPGQQQMREVASAPDQEPAQVPEEDSYVTFQKNLAKYLRNAGPEALARKRDKATGATVDYAIKEPVDELLQKLGTEEALVEFPDGPDAEMGIVDTKSGRRLRISPSWLERRDLLPPE